MKITIADKDYKVKFGYGVTRRLGEHWGAAGVLDVFEKALKVMGIDADAAATTDVDALDNLKVAQSILSFKNLETIGEITLFGIAAGEGVDVLDMPFSEDELMDAIMEDVQVATQLYTAFIMTMPRPKVKDGIQEQVNQKPATKKKKTK